MTHTDPKKHTKKEWAMHQPHTEWHEEFLKLTKKLQETEEIAKRAQSDYLRLKLDFDSYMQRNQEAQASAKVDALCEVARKILPAVNQLYHIVKTMPQEFLDNSRAQGVKLAYDKVTSDLAHLYIVPIHVNIGDDPDFLAHIPLSAQPTDDETLKGKVLELIDVGYKYHKNDKEQIILPAKVIVGQ